MENRTMIVVNVPWVVVTAACCYIAYRLGASNTIKAFKESHIEH